MATKKPAAGKWISETVVEFDINDKQSWRGQISTAPDGKRFAGVRKVIKKADGTEVMGKDGMAFLLDDPAAVVEQIKMLMSVFNSLGKHVETLKGSKAKSKGDVLRESQGVSKKNVPSKMTDVADAIRGASKAKGRWVIADTDTDETKYIVERVCTDENTAVYKTRTTETLDKAMEFRSSVIAENWLMTNQQTGLNKKWSVMKVAA